MGSVSARTILKQVKLPVELGRRLREEARRRRQPVSALVSEALERDLEHGGPAPSEARGAPATSLKRPSRNNRS